MMDYEENFMNDFDECPECDSLVIENIQSVDKNKIIFKCMNCKELFTPEPEKTEQKEKNGAWTYSSLIGRKSRDFFKGCVSDRGHKRDANSHRFQNVFSEASWKDVLKKKEDHSKKQLEN